MNILVIGGNGFIGSHLTDILRINHTVTVFDRSPNRFVKEFEGVKYIYGEFNNASLLKKALENINIVYHLLNTTVPLTANMDPVFDVQSNLVGTLNLLELIGKSEVSRFIFTSSGGTVYGNPQYLPMDENHPCNPIGSYGIVKNTIEHYVKMYSQNKGFSYLIVRPSNPYGPRQNYKGNQGLIAKLIYSGLTQENFTIWGDGSAIRDYIFIQDLVDFLKVSGLNDKSGTYNIGSGNGKSINEIVEMLSGVMATLPPLEYVEKNGFFVEKVVLNMENSHRDFDWKPKTTMEEGLAVHNSWMNSIQLD